MNLNELQEKKQIKFLGEMIDVSSEADIKETLKSLLSGRGIDSFSIFIDGNEILDSRNIPATFNEVNSLEVVRQVKGGGGN